jgi:hypothetical protein
MVVSLVVLFSLLLFLTQTVVKVPPSHWVAVGLKAPQNGSTVHLSFDVESGGSRIQAMVLTRDEAERFHHGRSVRTLFTSGFEESGDYRVLIPDAGDYVLLLDNRLEGRFPTEVSLRFDISHPADVRVRTVSRDRQRATVALSLLFFGAVVVFSATRFLRN